MISKVYEWYRMISPTPSTLAVDARTKAAESLIAEISGKDQDVILTLVQGVAYEFIGTPNQVATNEWLLRTLKLRDPAVSESLSENQLELRCLAAVTLGELFFQNKEDFKNLATFAATAFVSAMNARPLPTQRYLREMLEELSQLAFRVVERIADARRKRLVVEPLQDQVAISDLPSAAKDIFHLNSQIAKLQQNAILDREEISLFWYMTTGFSSKKGKVFSAMPVSVAAVHAALDIARSLLPPAPLNCFEILSAVVEAKRRPEECGAISLKDQLVSWTSEEWEEISRADSPDILLSVNFPVIFPMTWIANRMREGQSPLNWTECKKITHLRGDAKWSPSAIARQLLWEKTVVSLAGQTSAQC
jgi:hypothetical protein